MYPFQNIGPLLKQEPVGVKWGSIPHVSVEFELNNNIHNYIQASIAISAQMAKAFKFSIDNLRESPKDRISS